MAENGRGWVWYAAQEKNSGKPSVLAGIEVVLSVIAYWWIAAVWQTHLHLLVALIAAPLVLLRSDASVASAQRMWDDYQDNYERNRVPLKSVKGAIIVSSVILAGFGVIWFLSTHWLAHHNGWSLMWRTIIVVWLGWKTSFTLSLILGSLKELTYIMSILTKNYRIEFSLKCLLVIIIINIGVLIKILIRSIYIRIKSILKNMPIGLSNISINWLKNTINEDSTRIPELIPGVKQKKGAQIHFDTVFSLIINGVGATKIYGSLIFIFIFIPSLLWRYSLKSTFWFYAPLIYVASPGKFANPEHRRLMIDRNPPLLDWGRFVFAGVALFVAGCALVDWTFWRGLMRDTEVFSPVGWLLVLDWGKLWEQPWQIPGIIGAALTVVIFVWIDSLRKSRARLEKDGDDPETAMEAAFSTERHPGLTLYWLNRIRTVLVVASLVIGFVYFAKGSYEAGYLTRIEPMLSSVFGVR